MFKTLTAAAALALFAGTSYADPLSASLQIFEEVSRVSEEGVLIVERVEPESIVPNDRLIYVVSMSNKGDEVLTNIFFNVPLPNEIVINPDGILLVDGASATFATRQELGFFAPIEDLTVLDEEGQERPAGPEDIGVIRFSMADLEPEATISVEYAATVR